MRCKKWKEKTGLLVLKHDSFNLYVFYILFSIKFSLSKKFKTLKESTSTTIQWIFAYLVHYQEVQKRMQDELNDYVGSDRLIVFEDRKHLPYVIAVIMVGFLLIKDFF